VVVVAGGDVQEYLTRHYAERERRERSRLSQQSADTPSCPRALPYSTSGHTILKKSSTDPTSDATGSGGVPAAAPRSLKHATFSDRVTVLDGGRVHEEPLHHDDDDDDVASSPADSVDGSPPSQSGGFFLISSEPPDAHPADEPSPGPAAAVRGVERFSAVPEDVELEPPCDPAVHQNDAGGTTLAAPSGSAAAVPLKTGSVDSGLMNIFSTAATAMELEAAEEEAAAAAAEEVMASAATPAVAVALCPGSAEEPPRRKISREDQPRRKISGSLPPTRHVSLVDLMAQMRTDGERS